MVTYVRWPTPDAALFVPEDAIAAGNEPRGAILFSDPVEGNRISINGAAADEFTYSFRLHGLLGTGTDRSPFRSRFCHGNFKHVAASSSEAREPNWRSWSPRICR